MNIQKYITFKVASIVKK